MMNGEREITSIIVKKHDIPVDNIYFIGRISGILDVYVGDYYRVIEETTIKDGQLDCTCIVFVIRSGDVDKVIQASKFIESLYPELDMDFV